jgi:hypothetical protein
MALTRPRAYQIYDIDYKQATRVITVSNITLSGGAPSQADGVSLTLKDRVLVTGQTNKAQNGIYYVTTVGSGSNGTWTRSIDTDATGELLAGTIVMVTEGLVYADSQWKLTTDDPIVIGVSELIFEQNSAFAFGNVYANGTAVLASSVGDVLTLSAGNNISISGNNTSKTVTIGVTGISLNSISNGTSNVNVVSSGGNVTVGISGTSNVAVFSTTGANVTGTLGVSGNITGGNIVTGAQVVATGNITGGNISTAGQASVTGNLTTASAVNFNLPNSSSTDVTIASGLATAFKTRIGTTANNQYSWRTNLYYTGSAWAKDDATRGAWRLNQVCLTGNANSVMQFTYAPIGTTDVNELMTLTGEGVLTVSGNITGGNVSGTGITGTLLTATQTNITSVGTLGSLTVTANVAGGNLTTAGLISATGNITGGNLSGTSITGTLSTAAQTNITSLGTLSSLSVTGNITGGNVSGTRGVFTNLVGTLETASQPNITSVGTLSSLTVTANVAGGNLTTAGQVVAVGNISGGNILGNGAGLTGINAFSNISVTGGNSAVADSIADTLTFTAGSGITLVMDSATDTLTIAASSGSDTFVDGADFGTVTETVTASDDLGSVTDAVIAESDLGTIVTAGLIYPDQFVLPSYTTGTLPSASISGAMIYVTNESGGAVPAFSDGTNWRRVTDRAIVS